MSTPSSSFLRRLNRVGEELTSNQLDALLVSHPPNIRYLTGFSGSAGLFLISPEKRDLLVDSRYAIAARHVVNQHQDLREAVNVVVPPDSYDQTLLELLVETGARRIGVEAAYMSIGRFHRLSVALAEATQSRAGGPTLVPTERVVERIRVVKDQAEVCTLKEAGRRIARVAREVRGLPLEGRTELDVAVEIEAILRRSGFERPAFETIVASGPNSALPHARPGRRTLLPGDGVVLDFGGVYDGYCVDLTRTVQVGAGRPEFGRLYAAVAEAQRAAIAMVRPGVLASDVDRAARDVLGRHGLAEAFGHGTGHGLGLEVHEEPRVGRRVRGQPDPLLEPGMVFTIEPGAYVENVGGVRIEDDVLVTESGCEVLTAD